MNDCVCSAYARRLTNRLADWFFRTPPVSLGQIQADGLVHVCGRVHSIECMLTAPLTGTPCVYYRAVAQGMVREVVAEDACAFLIEDKSGDAIVMMDRYDVETVPGPICWDPTYQAPAEKPAREAHAPARSGRLPAPLPPSLATFLAAHGIRPKLVPPAWRFLEAVIEEDDLVAVLGWARWEAGAVASPYRASRGRLTLAAPPNGKLLISANPDLVRATADVLGQRQEW